MKLKKIKNYYPLNFLLLVVNSNKGVMEMKNKETENFNNSNITTETPSPKEQYNIILKFTKVCTKILRSYTKNLRIRIHLQCQSISLQSR